MSVQVKEEFILGANCRSIPVFVVGGIEDVKRSSVAFESV